ncbi:MAG: UPF0146 family protein [Candidatus Omnitrophica bacterium]|nr:UPF0146 family protein [Candidatus Omnitrophota bacterium]
MELKGTHRKKGQCKISEDDDIKFNYEGQFYSSTYGELVSWWQKDGGENNSFSIQEHLRRDEIGRAIAYYILQNYSKARKIVEIGVGAVWWVCAYIKKRGPANLEVIATDVNPLLLKETSTALEKYAIDVQVVRDDVTKPCNDIYDNANLIYAIRPYPELTQHLIDLAERIKADLLIYKFPQEIDDQIKMNFEPVRYKKSRHTFYLRKKGMSLNSQKFNITDSSRFGEKKEGLDKEVNKHDGGWLGKLTAQEFKQLVRYRCWGDLTPAEQLDIVLRYVESPEKKRLLELGCGWGGFALIAATKGNFKEVIAIDRQTDTIRLAKEISAYRFLVDFDEGISWKIEEVYKLKKKGINGVSTLPKNLLLRTADAAWLPFIKNSSIDIVYTSTALEDISLPVLKEIVRVLKDKGLFFFDYFSNNRFQFDELLRTSELAGYTAKDIGPTTLIRICKIKSDNDTRKMPESPKTFRDKDGGNLVLPCKERHSRPVPQKQNYKSDISDILECYIPPYHFVGYKLIYFKKDTEKVGALVCIKLGRKKGAGKNTILLTNLQEEINPLSNEFNKNMNSYDTTAKGLPLEWFLRYQNKIFFIMELVNYVDFRILDEIKVEAQKISWRIEKQLLQLSEFTGSV